jgi:DNA-binding beta-propeller fold protein YncE
MKFAFAAFLLASVKACDTAGAVTTLAGSRSAAFADGTGTDASFNLPSGVAFSPDQTMIAVADKESHRIRLVIVSTGVVSTLAGSGSPAFADGTGTDASFNEPYGVAFSPDQTLIAVADRKNNRIRLVIVSTGVVGTLAGSGSAAFADGTGTDASFHKPGGVAFSPDQTLIAVADSTNNRIRLVFVSTGVVSTLAGSGSPAFADGTGTDASFNEPSGVAFSPDQTMLAVADRENNRIRLVIVSTGVVSTLAGSAKSFADGTGTDASFNLPSGVAFSPDQTMIAVADRGNSRIRLVSLATGVVSTLAGSAKSFADGTGSAASFKLPSGVAFSPDQTMIAVADQNNHCIRRVCTTDAPTAAPTATPTATPY